MNPYDQTLQNVASENPYDATVRKVYHGTPHRFAPTANNPLGEFDHSKMGTGEGAQAYGWGTYLAENKKVADTYRKDLSNYEQPFIQFGKTKIAGNALSDVDLRAFKHLESGQKMAGQFKHNTHYYAKKSAERDEEALKRLEEFGRDVKFGHEINRGHTYHVEIPERHVKRMLDWDASLDDQHEAVKKAINHVGVNPQSIGRLAASKIKLLAESPGLADWAKRDLLKDASNLESPHVSMQYISGTLKRMPLEYGISESHGPFQSHAKDFLKLVKASDYVPNMNTGGGAYGLLSAFLGGDREASEHLLSFGSPGIKYKDAASRGAEEGTRNFVLIDPSIAKIVERE